MVLGFLKSNSTPVAIDFGFSDLKMIQLAPGNPPTVVAAARTEIPEHARNDQSARFAFLAEHLPRLLRDGGFTARRAVCSIPAWQTFVQHMQVRKQEGDVTEQLKVQLQSVIACDPNNIVIRHVEVCDLFRENQSLTEVICFAVVRDVVMRQLELVQKCRLEIAGFHAEPIALTKAFAHLYRRQDDEKTTTLYLDVGCSCSKVVIAHGDEIRFARSVPVGGRHFDQRLAEKMSCDAATARARRLKEAQTAEGETPATGESRSFDARGVRSQNQAAATAVATDRRTTSVPPEFNGVGAGDPIADILGDGRAAENPVRSATADLVRQLAEEVRMCLRYHRRLFADRTIDRLVFVGGESRDAALCREIAQQVGVPAYQGDPFSRLRRGGGEIDLHDIQPHPGWAVPIGLCDCPAE